MSLRIAPSVRRAVHEGRPVVALESTVVTHGLPRPQNLTLARRLETVIRDAGATPATVGIVAGELIVGLDAGELAFLADTDSADKASLWNLAAVIARRGHAGTTVAATLHAAATAGISVFATGGIGGVHDHPFDESADLQALARSSVVTVCAGPKSILDAAATLERLESMGVSVVGYRSDRLAGFLVSQIDLPLPARVESGEHAAAVLRAQRALGLHAGVLLSNPVSRGIEPRRFQDWLARARSDAEAEGIRGRDTTPFLLARLAELSGGATVETNLRLLEENARLAAEVATGLASQAAAADAAPAGGQA